MRDPRIIIGILIILLLSVPVIYAVSPPSAESLKNNAQDLIFESQEVREEARSAYCQAIGAYLNKCFNKSKEACEELSILESEYDIEYGADPRSDCDDTEDSILIERTGDIGYESQNPLFWGDEEWNQ